MSRPPGHRPRKRFGQNFLTDPGVIDNIVNAIGPGPDDHIVEIGPGQGALTDPLASIGCSLDVVELDRDLVPGLLASHGLKPGFRLHNCDALSLDYGALAEPGKTLRVVGNLPYNISTPLLVKLLDNTGVIADMHFMLQLEVVQRLAAEPGSKHWGRLGVLAQYQCDVEMLFEVDPEAFFPPPKVRSAIVRLTPRAQPPGPVVDRALLSRTVQSAFAQRRKTLRNNFKGLIDMGALSALGIDPGARAETLSIEQFIAITAAIHE